MVPSLQEAPQPARNLSSTAALKGDKIARRTLAYYHNGVFAKYQKVRVEKLRCVMLF